VLQNYRPAYRRRYARGFTLVELMVVVVIITALAALAVPSILRQMRDRRTRQAAEEIASLYRQARLRALGRGSAVMVRYNAATGFQIREAVVGGSNTCARLPSTSCTTTQWGQGPTVANGDQLISGFNPTSNVYDGVVSTAHAGDPNLGGGSAVTADPSVSVLDICFTPMGRTLFRIVDGANTPLFPMTGVPLIEVKRHSDDTHFEGLTRNVIIPPNGLARTDVAQ